MTRTTANHLKDCVATTQYPSRTSTDLLNLKGIIMKSTSYLRSSSSATPVALASKRVPATLGRSIGLRLAFAVSAAIALSQAAHALNPQPLPPRDARFVGLAPRVALNPQPLPPRQVVINSDVSRVALNPQPLPPRESRFLSPASRVALNPQPLPPRDTAFLSQASRVALNPQPLPPRPALTASPASPVALNPQPLPPRVVLPTIRYQLAR